MKTINYTMSISLGLIILMFVEGCFTLGNAFLISNYGVMSCIIQAILITFTVSLSSMICNKELINK